MKTPLVTMGARIVFTALVAVTSASAQDLPTSQMADHAQVMRQDTLTRSLLRPDRAGSRRPTARQTALCASKWNYRARYGADNPSVRKLYGLCRGVGL